MMSEKNQKRAASIYVRAISKTGVESPDDTPLKYRPGDAERLKRWGTKPCKTVGEARAFNGRIRF